MLLMDCLIHAKNGMHLTRNSTTFKANFCRSIGINPRTKSKDMVYILRDLYAYNNMLDRYNEIVAKFS